jgi:3-oxoacyl-[acyl-carrier-protein] synthase-1
MKALAATAFRNHLEATMGLNLFARVASLPMVLALPEPEASAGEVQLLEIQRALESITAATMPQTRLLFPKPGFHALGRAAFFAALAQGLDVLRTGKHEAVVVGAVDSWGDRKSLQYLASKNRILGSTNRDGLIPGEAAGFVLLVAPDVKLPPATPALGLLGVSLAQEQHHFLQGEPNLADGLTSAFGKLADLPQIRGRRVDHVLSCQTGESFWGEEFSRAYLRNASLMPEPLTEDIAAATLGDAGAASGAFQLRMAFYHARRLANSERSGRSTPGGSPRLLIYASSDAGLIGSCAVDGLGVERWAGQGDVTPKPRRTGTVARMLGFSEGHRASAAGPAVAPIVGPGLADRVAVEEWALGRGEDHLDEIGFLSHLRRAYFRNPTVSWLAVAELDARIVNHLNAFEAWGKPALAFGREEGLTSDDDYKVRGGALALASVGSAEEDWPALLRALESLVEEKARERISAWVQGVKLALGEHVGSRLEPLLASQHSEVRAAAAEVMGYRRQAKPERLAAHLQHLFEQKTMPGPAPAKPGAGYASANAEMQALGMALARMRFTPARPLLERVLATGAKQTISPDLVFAAASLGSSWALDVARRALPESPDDVHPDLYLVLALGSGKQDIRLFLSLQPESVRCKQSLCAAMGVLGAPEFVPRLIERLRKEKEDGLRLAAAEALQRITGAGLRETVPDPDDEPSDSEPSEGSDEGNPVQATGRQTKRRMVERTSRDPQAWAKWWAEHGRAFPAGERIRLGRRFQLDVCVEEAAGTGFPQQTRALAMRELVMRSAGQTPECGGCEPDWYVEQQVRSLNAWRAWCTANRNAGKNGR